MKCAKLHLQQRAKGKVKRENSSEKPRRYCQKRLVDPDHDEDPRWIDIFDRFHCNMNCDQLTDALDSVRAQPQNEDMVLTVQTLKFQGDVDQTTRPRTSFKYKRNTEPNKHRMFVKQAVSENDLTDDDRTSQLTYYYFEDYVKYLCNTDRSRPTSEKSSILMRGLSKDKDKQNKATQVELAKHDEKRKSKSETKIKNVAKKCSKQDVKDEIRDVSETIENTKITYQKSGKRKSLTISRAQSPETVQVIRVDVVCNYSSSTTPDYEENKKVECSTDRSEPILDCTALKDNYFAHKYNNHFATKYLLTNTIRSLDENLSGGAKVTLLCKTFKLSDRNPVPDKKGKDKKNTKALRNLKRDNRVKNNILKSSNSN